MLNFIYEFNKNGAKLLRTSIYSYCCLFFPSKVHNSPHCYGSVYTCHRSISLFFSNQEEIMISGHEVRKNGVR